MLRKIGNTSARLFLDDHDVGRVEVKGWDDAWGFGEFDPGEGFRRYARHFGDWSRLLHAPHADDRLTEHDRAALREVEYQIDRLNAKLFLVESKEWRRITELNIDGQMVEWREEFRGRVVPGVA